MARNTTKRNARKNTDAAKTDENATPKVGNIVPAKYKARYAEHGGSSGDEIANLLGTECQGEKGKIDTAKLVAVGAANGIDVNTRWGHLNVGQQRMNLGNVLRGRRKRGEKVVIGKTVFEAVDEAA